MQNEKNNTPMTNGATTLVVDSITSAEMTQDELKELADEINRQDTKIVADKYCKKPSGEYFCPKCGAIASIAINPSTQHSELVCTEISQHHYHNVGLTLICENLYPDKKGIAAAVEIARDIYGLNEKKPPFRQNFENLPVELTEQPRFFLVGADKVPLIKDWSNPSNQKIYNEIHGIAGFDCTGHGEGDDYLFLDFDHIFGADGEFINETAEEFVSQILDALGGYCEKSISSTGLHMFAVPSVDYAIELPKMAGGAKASFYFTDERGKNCPKLEIFYRTKARYCLLTGNLYCCEKNSPITYGEKADEAIKFILAQIERQNAQAPTTKTTPPSTVSKAENKKSDKNFDSKFFSDSDYNSARTLKMIECIDVSKLSDSEWLAFMSACKNRNIDYSIVDAKNAQDSSRYNSHENFQRWQSLNDPSFDIETLHGLAKRFGYIEKDVYREWHEESKKFELKKILNSDTDVEKILSWQKLNDEIAPDVLKYLNDDAKIYLENLKEEDITTSIILSSKTKYAVANCLFYDFFSDCATNFVTRMKSAIQTAKEKVKSATAENPVADEIKSLSSIRPSDFDKAVSVVITEVKHKHRDFLFKKNIEKARERREQYEQAPSTTRTNCPDCPVDLVLPYQTSFEKNRGIFANDDKGRPKCISRTPLVPTRQFVNPSEGTHHYEIAINTHGNEWQKVIYDAESLFNAKNIMNLVNDGARFSSKTAADVAEWLATILSIPENQESIQRVDIYNQPGWTDETCTEFIYPQNEEKYLVRTKNFDYQKAFAERGDKSEWLKMFKKVLDKSAVTRLTLGAALSAPLVNVLNIRNLQLHLSCPSGNGKSALVKFATSAYGNPEKFKFKFNGTSNSFETQSTLFNDLPSWLEELQSANKKQRENIDQIIHDYESGVGRGRNTKNNFLQKQKYFHGCRISTGEQNLTNQFSGEGAISRILEIARADIFDNGFAIDVHKFCTENFGHFGQNWINFIIEYKTELCKEFDDLEKNYRERGLMSNHATTFAACHTAMIFFCKMLDIDANSIKNILIHDFYDFVGSGELPSKDRATNASRALQTVAETVASHPKFFKAEKYNSGEDVLTLANSDEGSAMYDYGFILKNGDVAIYPSALREILKDYPSVDALIRNFAECGYLDCGNDDKRPYQKAAKCQGKTIWVYRFKKSALEN